MKEKHITPKTKSRQIIIAGDSVIKGLKGWMMARDNRLKVHSFSGATASEMEYFIKPLLERKPSHVIIHCGTNDLAQGASCNEVIQRITNLTRNIVSNGMTCSVSMLTKRTDGLNPLVNQVNNLLEKAFESEARINIINNEAINEYHLNGSGLHLNRKGDAALTRNFINHIKNKPNFFNESTEFGPIETDQDKIPADNGSFPIPENETSKTWCNGTSKFPRFMSLNIFSLLPHVDNLRLLVDDEKPHTCIN